MQILINQVATELSTVSNALTLSEILLQINLTPPFAIAKNGVFIPKKDYPQTAIIDQDQLEIISPVTGG